MKISENISELPLFEGINETERKEIHGLACMSVSSYTKEDIIFHTGELVHNAGIVISGSVHIAATDLWGNRSILSNVSQGQIFAETYALCQEPMMVDAVASEDSMILFIKLNLLLSSEYAHCSWHNKLMKNILDASVRKNLMLSTRIFCTSAKTIRSRLLTYLSSVSVKKKSTSFQIPFDRQQLADYLNVERSALSKELGKMRDDGLIEFHKNSFVLKQESGC